eukprot:11219250-Lingulodinium_polyedra.AAC.1
MHTTSWALGAAARCTTVRGRLPREPFAGGCSQRRRPLKFASPRSATRPSCAHLGARGVQQRRAFPPS